MHIIHCYNFWQTRLDFVYKGYQDWKRRRLRKAVLKITELDSICSSNNEVVSINVILRSVYRFFIVVFTIRMLPFCLGLLLLNLNLIFAQSELKQSGPGAPFSLKCPEGSFVSSISSTYSGSGDDHRVYQLKCSKVETQVLCHK